MDLFFVYVLRNPEGRLYVGHTAGLERRIRQHQEGKAGWTRSRGPWELVHTEAFPDRSAAMKRERELKRGCANKALREMVESSAVNPSLEGS